MRRREQVGHDLHPLLAEVHAAREVAVVARELGVVAQERDELAVAARPDAHDAVPVLVLEGHDVVSELRPKARLDVRRWQRAWCACHSTSP